MNPAKVDRNKVCSLTDLPNIGKAMAQDLRLLGIQSPENLIRCDAYQLYYQLCQITHVKHDPCVIDVFLSVVAFMNGQPARPWWEYTAERKQYLLQSAGHD